MSYTEKRLTRLTLQHSDDTVSWETPYNDTSLKDVVKAFSGLLVTDGWDEDSVMGELIRYGIEHKRHSEEVYNILNEMDVKDTIFKD